MYYGSTDGGTNPAAWDNVFPAGNIEGQFSIDLLNLMPGTQFYYRYLAFNAAAQTAFGPIRPKTSQPLHLLFP